jgi:hypothetical protein
MIPIPRNSVTEPNVACSDVSRHAVCDGRPMEISAFCCRILVLSSENIVVPFSVSAHPRENRGCPDTNRGASSPLRTRSRSGLRIPGRRLPRGRQPLRPGSML